MMTVENRLPNPGDTEQCTIWVSLTCAIQAIHLTFLHLTHFFSYIKWSHVIIIWDFITVFTVFFFNSSFHKVCMPLCFFLNTAEYNCIYKICKNVINAPLSFVYIYAVCVFKYTYITYTLKDLWHSLGHTFSNNVKNKLLLRKRWGSACNVLLYSSQISQTVTLDCFRKSRHQSDEANNACLLPSKSTYVPGLAAHYLWL